jgi:CheY-like chemotaxis protein
MGGRISLESAEGAGATFEFTIPLSADPNSDAAPAFIAPDLTDKAVMLVATQTIEMSLVARRLERWGAHTCTVSDPFIAKVLLPERSWHAVLVDHMIGEADMLTLGEDALSYVSHRVAMFTPAGRHEIAPSTMAAFNGYLVKPLRAASLAARLAPLSATLVPEIPEGDDTQHEAPAAAVASVAEALSILVAEDNEINALLIRSLLKRLGHQCTITTNGEEALESWLAADSAGTPYDAVLMDVQMPKLDGIETTKRIRAREASRGSRTIILALTANTLVDDRYACFEAGMDGFLIKPLDREKLADALVSVRANMSSAHRTSMTVV